MFKSVAIDGPSGSGKSTIARLLAKKLSFNYLDTGAMYRSFTYYYLKNKIDITNEEMVNEHIKNIDLSIKDGDFYLEDENISKIIRSEEVTKNVSLVSSYRKVREHLVDAQRAIAKKSNIILDGRDIGSVVLKDASIKFFLTADPEVRAKRRLNDDKDQSGMSFEEILADIIRRDEFDSTREVTPLVQAEDAILIDSSNLTIEEVVEKMLSYMEEKNVI